MLILAAKPSRTWVCGRSLSGIAGLSPSGGIKVTLLSGLCVVR